LRRVCCGDGRGGALHPEDDMARSTVSTLALAALAVSCISSGAAQAQTTGGPAATEPGMMVPAAATAPLPGTIAPSSLYGAGPPTDGLDSHPYREREMHKARVAGDKSAQPASAAGGKARQQARGAAKTSGSGTTN
jgi:hypothetical protein